MAKLRRSTVTEKKKKEEKEEKPREARGGKEDFQGATELAELHVVEANQLKTCEEKENVK